MTKRRLEIERVEWSEKNEKKKAEEVKKEIMTFCRTAEGKV